MKWTFGFIFASGKKLTVGIKNSSVTKSNIMKSELQNEEAQSL